MNRVMPGRAFARPGRSLLGGGLASGVLLLLGACASEPELSESDQARIATAAREVDALIELFVRSDPTWPERRDAAIEDPVKATLLFKKFWDAMDNAFEREEFQGVPHGSYSKSSRLQAELVAMSKATVPFLVTALAHEDKVTSERAADTLSRIGAAAVPVLGERFEASTSQAERGKILGVIGRMQDPAQIEVLLSHSSDPSWQLRAEALLGAGALAGLESASDAQRDEVRRVLRKHLADPDPFVRRKAADALAKVGEVESVRILLEHFKGFSTAEEKGRLTERGYVLKALQRATGLVRAARIEQFENWIAQQEER